MTGMLNLRDVFLQQYLARLTMHSSDVVFLFHYLGPLPFPRGGLGRSLQIGTQYFRGKLPLNPLLKKGGETLKVYA